MNAILLSALKTLSKTKTILSILNDDLLSDSSIPPYNSSVGSHIRHILDFYQCILEMTGDFQVDLTNRRRDLLAEANCIAALNYCNEIENKLKTLDCNFDEYVFVADDLGTGKIKIKYTMGALLAQANSHTIHHYAIINHILYGLKISIEDPDFGYNPTTLNQKETITF